MRSYQRAVDNCRPITLDVATFGYGEGKCLASFGETKVLCCASVEERVPPFLKGKRTGWITAEYGMLPRSTHTRSDREAARGKQSGRTQEIQRLIGRSLRAVANLTLLGERQIKIDCDVLQADGGTRTAAITGAYVALHNACVQLISQKIIPVFPLTEQLAALSCGRVKGKNLLDLDYKEDSTAELDANFVGTQSGKWIEIQTTAEDAPFCDEVFDELKKLARTGLGALFAHQKEVLLPVP